MDPYSPKQVEFIKNANAKFNLAHGSVRAGKTVCSLFKFLSEVLTCPGNSIAIIGYTIGSIYNNIINLVLNAPELTIFRPYCTWSRGSKEFTFGNRKIACIGAGDEGALGLIQGMTLDLCYCDEMTLYPDNVIDMLKTRLSRDHSKLYASMNPKHPTHKLKQWIDLADSDPQYYELHFTLDDNPFIRQEYKDDLKRTLSGLFYKRNYLGLWCLAEGAIFDFFDHNLHVVPRAPRTAEYWIVGIDYGTNNPFCALLIGVSSGKYTQQGRCFWVEDEFYWDSEKQKRQKTNSEYADDLQKWLDGYPIKNYYIDPSAAAFKEELRRRAMHPVDANNDVSYGLEVTLKEMKKGNLFILPHCVNLIREIESYVWDIKKSEKGEDVPLKKDDHSCDALRYAIASHKVSNYKPTPEQEIPGMGWGNNRYYPRMG